VSESSDQLIDHPSIAVLRLSRARLLVDFRDPFIGDLFEGLDSGLWGNRRAARLHRIDPVTNLPLGVVALLAGLGEGDALSGIGRVFAERGGSGLTKVPVGQLPELGSIGPDQEIEAAAIEHLSRCRGGLGVVAFLDS